MKAFIRSAISFFVIFLISYKEAYAYIDPEGGRYVFQVSIASSIASIFVIKLFWNHFKIFFKRLFDKRKKDGKLEKWKK